MKSSTVIAIQKLRELQLTEAGCSKPSGLIKLEDAEKIIEQLEIDLLNQAELDCIKQIKGYE